MDKCGREGLYKLLAGYEDKSAYALCTFAYYDDNKKDVFVFEGKCHVSLASNQYRNSILKSDKVQVIDLKHLFRVK